MERALLFSVALAFNFFSYARADNVSIASTAYSSGSLGVVPYQTFYSRPDLHPPEFNILTPATSAAAPGYVFLSYRGNSSPKQQSPVIFDVDGSLVWSGPDFGVTMGNRVQTYQGKPVMTFFNGSTLSLGYGNGVYYLLSPSYETVAVVDILNQTAGTSDFHEMQITKNDTALVESWRVVQADLSPVGGSKDGWTFDCVFQEIDIATNTLLFEWRSLDKGNVPISETYFAISNNAGNSSTNPFDYCHLNSMDKDDNGDYLISLRGTSAAYKISGATGEIIWRMGGKSSNFTFGEDAKFWYQHDPRWLNNYTEMTVFDNGGTDGIPAYSNATARGVHLAVDQETFTVELIKAYAPTFGKISGSQGGMQALDNSNFFVGWGSQPYFTEYSADGTIVLNVQFATAEYAAYSYRAYKEPWIATPPGVPDVAVVSNSSGMTAYVSWNGATEVAKYTVMGGNNASSMSALASYPRTGFETTLALNSTACSIKVAAFSSNGTRLGVSDVYYNSNCTTSDTGGKCRI